MVKLNGKRVATQVYNAVNQPVKRKEELIDPWCGSRGKEEKRTEEEISL